MLEVHEVTKRFEPPPWWLRLIMRAASKEPVDALRDVSFSVGPGDVVGLVGPNGAGKTTLIKLMCGLLVPTSGYVRLGGFDTVKHPRQAVRHLGLVLEGDRGIYDRLTGRHNLEFFGVMAGLAPAVAARRAAETMDLLELSARDKLTFGYSAGMRMRLSIGRALMADPDVVFLDEPTRSLDPVASRFLGRLVRELSEQGKAVVLSNHRLDEVVDTCSRVIALVGGRVRFDGPPSSVPRSRAGREAAALGDFLEAEAGLP